MADRNWRKSSHSGPNGDCVELNRTLDAVRDSKNGAALHLRRRGVTELLRRLKTLDCR